MEEVKVSHDSAGPYLNSPRNSSHTKVTYFAKSNCEHLREAYPDHLN